jgi:uncharacterized protein (DUF433 family)
MKKKNQRTTTCKLSAEKGRVVAIGQHQRMQIQAVGPRGGQYRRPSAMQKAIGLLSDILEKMVDCPDAYLDSEIAGVVSALSLAKIAEKADYDSPESIRSVFQSHLDVKTRPIPAESVVEFEDYPQLNLDLEGLSTEKSIWRRKMEKEWQKHLTKDEFHRPVVRSTGIPVMVIVDHVRKGMSWDAICNLYPGICQEEIRASLSIATELGWTGQDLD